MKLLTLVLITRDDQILLGMKKRGFGGGWWNGFGGKVELGEDIVDAAKREVLEEAGLELKSLEKAGLIHFNFPNDPVVLEVHLFKSDSFLGEPKETEEMRPQWFSKDSLPFDQMWADDPVWFPYFLSGKKFKAEFWFDNDKRVARHNLQEVEAI